MRSFVAFAAATAAFEQPVGDIEHQLSAKLQPILDAMAVKYDMAVGQGLHDSACG